MRIVDTVSVAAKPLPGQPAHGWGSGEAIFEAEDRLEAQQDPGYRKDPYLKRPNKSLLWFSGREV